MTIDPARFCRAQRAYRTRNAARRMAARAAAWSIGAVAVTLLFELSMGLGGPARTVAAYAASGSIMTPPPKSRDTTGTGIATLRLHDGHALTTALTQAGIAPRDAGQAAALIDAAIFPDSVADDIVLSLRGGVVDRHGRHSLETLSLRPRLDLNVTVRRGPGGLVLLSRPIAIDASPVEIDGTVGADLGQSLAAAAAPPMQAAAIASALRERLGPTTRLAASDRFEMVFEQARAADGRVVTGEPLYAAIRRGDRPLVELVQWERHGLSDVAAGQSAGDGANPALPIAGHLTSRYGLRFHPILGYTRLHAGIDIGAPWGTVVVAAKPGVVRFAGWHGGHGEYVRIDHGAGLATGYAHLSRMAVVAGEHIAAGQAIGYVGSTGLSTGPHLHYEVFRDGRPVDPLRDGVAASRDRQPPSLAFAAAVASLRSLLKTP